MYAITIFSEYSNFGKKFQSLDIVNTKEEVEKWLSTNLPDENFKISVIKNVVKAEHYTIEETWFGTEHVREQKNGIKVRTNVAPSAEYKDRMEERAAIEAERAAEEAKIMAREKLINDKMRELAIAELEKEGAL